METKFKVGDNVKIIKVKDSMYNIFANDEGIIIEILSDDCIRVEFGNGSLLFEKEHIMLLQETKESSNINSSCPKCNGELKDHYSDWAGKDIKKCKACGWC